MTSPISPASVVSFWKEAGPAKWFAKDQAFDDLFRKTLEEAHWAAARREYDDWMETPEGALALMILLDQFPRNCFRATGHQFATDSLALMYANQAVERGHHLAVASDMKNFILLPFEHSELIENQDRYLKLAAGDDDMVKWGEVHRDIIVKFGRFPHRNRSLGRDTTAEEQTFLDSGGFGG